MVNCNPETVSTDYDTADRLYFEPLTFEDVLEVVHAEQASGTVAGVICTLGGQTPLGLAQRLKDAGVPVLGTQPEAIDLAEHRGAFGRVLAEAGPARAQARHRDLVRARPRRSPTRSATRCWSGRPTSSAGAAWRSSTTRTHLSAYISRATEITPDHPVLVDRFLDDAVEIDVDALYDGIELYLGGVMEHIEEAGIHSGDSACALPPITLGAATSTRSAPSTLALAAGRRRARAAQRAVRAGRRRPLRARGQPARQPHGAVRVQGDGGAAGQGGGPDRARRDDRRAAGRGPAAAYAATAATCPPTRRSRSRRRCCRSTGSAPRPATRSTRSSARR